jgi:hypothetical protein
MAPLIPFAAEGGAHRPPRMRVYSAKFLIGELRPSEKDEGPVAAGRYTTAINVHNPNGETVRFRKKAILLYDGSRGEPARERPTPPARPDFQVLAALEPDWGLEIDAADIREELLGGAHGEPVPPAGTFIKGWVVIEVFAPTCEIDVVAVYTVAPLDGGPVSMTIDRVPGIAVS